jgi:hypothetical protein
MSLEKNIRGRAEGKEFVAPNKFTGDDFSLSVEKPTDFTLDLSSRGTKYRGCDDKEVIGNEFYDIFSPKVIVDRQGPLPELSPQSSEVFEDCPEDERAAYIRSIKNFTRDPATETDFEDRGGLYPPDQSLIQQIRAIDSLHSRETYLSKAKQQFEKSALTTVIAAEIGHRPASQTFDAAETDRKIPDEVKEMIDDVGAVYLKQDKSAKGKRVVRVAKTDDGYTVQDLEGEYPYADLTSYTLPLPDRYGLDNALWTAEHEIPIAKTSSGNGWEIRYLPPYGVKNAYAKVGADASHINNIAQGGKEADPLHIVRDVISTQDPTLDEDTVFQKARAFLRTGYTLASEVKGLTDALQVELAGKIIKPEDLKDPSAYDTVMERAFTGNYLCVDITGVWDEEAKDLYPMIIEAQQDAGMSKTMTKALYPVCRDQTMEKRAIIQTALK